ncbi:hypothetical protein [Escherichia coli]|uniref:hypothetical protein n=1 Tax=Escherichia coli TaxID=562 RepID=UPI0039A6E40C
MVKPAQHAERTGGVHALLHDVLTEDEINKLSPLSWRRTVYIPRCDHALRALRNTRFMADLQQHVKGRVLTPTGAGTALSPLRDFRPVRMAADTPTTKNRLR